jgi:hypothetical protein
VQAYDAGLEWLNGLDFTNEATFKAGVNLEADTDYYAPGGTDVADADIVAAITRDSEWDTAAEINAATTDDDFMTLLGEQTVTGLKKFTGGLESYPNDAGNYNLTLGTNAGAALTIGALRNVIVGSGAGNDPDGLTDEDDMVVIGYGAGAEAAGSVRSVYIGRTAGYKADADNSVYIGFDAGNDDDYDNAIAIGSNATVTADNQTVIGNDDITSGTIYGLMNFPDGITGDGSGITGIDGAGFEDTTPTAPTGTTLTVDLDGVSYVFIDTSSATGDVTLTLNNAVDGKLYMFELICDADEHGLTFPGSATQSLSGGATIAPSGPSNTDVVTAVYNGTVWRVLGMSPDHG